MTDHSYTGRCLCGAVTYSALSEHREAGICHCRDCRRWIGGPFIGVDCKSLETQGPVRWYSSSDHAERGSCETCGSALFWRMKTGAHPTVAAGSLDDDSLLTGTKSHIFVDGKPAYYDFADEAPRLTGDEVIAAFLEEMRAEDA